jgi:hypothetical protein
VFDSKVRTNSREQPTFKLGSVIQNDSPRNPKPCDDIFPQEAFGINISDIRLWFSLYPFGEVVCGDDQESFVSWGSRKGPTMSRSHWAKGQGLDKGFISRAG